MKQKLVLIGSILAGLLAFWLTNQYLRAERDRLYAGAEQIKVLVAGRDLAAGTTLKFEDLAQKSLFKSAVGENVFLPKDLNTVLDKKLRYSLKRAEPLWWSYVDMPQGFRQGLAPMVKPGLRAVSVAIGGDAGVSGLVQPNDRVDILGTFSFPSRTKTGQMENVTLTLLQDVSVLATGQRLAKQEFEDAERWARAGGYSTVTFEVTPREAELLVFAQNVQGRLTLALRHPEDVSFERNLPEVNFEQLEKSLPELNLYRQRAIRHKPAP